MVGGDPRDQDTRFVLEDLLGDANDLFRTLARAVDHLRKSLSQGPMIIDLGKTQLRQWRGLEGLQDLVAADAAFPE